MIFFVAACVWIFGYLFLTLLKISLIGYVREYEHRGI